MGAPVKQMALDEPDGPETSPPRPTDADLLKHSLRCKLFLGIEWRGKERYKLIGQKLRRAAQPPVDHCIQERVNG